MRPTLDSEIERHDRLIARLALRPPIKKLQRALETVVELWWPPDYSRTCLGNRVHWRVPPSADAVAIVAAHHTSDRPDVRRLVARALRQAAPHAQEAATALNAGLSDGNPLVRMDAARAAAALELGEELAEPLTARLADTVWTVRWNAARALGRTSRRTDALAVLLASQPEPANRTFHEWAECVETFADLAAAQERLAALAEWL